MVTHMHQNACSPGPQVFSLSLDRKAARFKGFLALLTIPGPEYPRFPFLKYFEAAEMQSMPAFASPSRRMAYLAGRICAKEALVRYTDSRYGYREFTIEKGVFGFSVVLPPASCPNLQVSIAHCSDLSGAVAFHESHPLGIDMEKISARMVGFPDDLITREEKELLAGQAGEADVLYTTLWTAKEALSKILKTGLLLPFGLLAVEAIIPHPFGWELHYKNFCQYKCLALRVGDRVLALAVPRQTTLAGDFDRMARYGSPTQNQ